MGPIVLIAFLIVSFFSCTTNDLSQAEEADRMVDSLIQISRLNDHIVLVSFGADAVTAVNTEKGIVVIDAGISTGLTTKFRKRIEAEFQSSNFAYVINTHAHPDHNGGNSVFTDAKVVGHENGLEEIEEQWANTSKVMLALQKIVEEYNSKLKACKWYSDDWYDAFKQLTRYQYAYLDVKNSVSIKKPNVTFSDSLNIAMGDITFEMKYFGKCHSNSDIFIFIPELKVLFSGDLIFQYGRPSINDKDLEEMELWRRAVLWTEKRLHNIDIIISGHGQILSIDDLKSFNRIILEQG